MAHLVTVFDAFLVEVTLVLVRQLLPELAGDLIQVGEVAPALGTQRQVVAVARHQPSSFLVAPHSVAAVQFTLMLLRLLQELLGRCCRLWLPRARSACN